jgi:hypothetical protein
MNEIQSLMEEIISLADFFIFCLPGLHFKCNQDITLKTWPHIPAPTSTKYICTIFIQQTTGAGG